ncbi:MAG: M50 family metallopeptidase [bacterium]|nr:MAG: M50 family metallopeptidase [bacterium]
MKETTHRRLIFLGGFALYFASLWLLWDTPVVYPLKIFVVLLHELSHAAAAVVTGGQVDRIVLDPNQGGAAYVAGGNAFLTLSAGYLGSLAWGVLFILAAQARWMRTRILTGIVGALVLLLTIVYVRSLFGVIFGIAFGAVMLVVARKLPEGTNRIVVLVLGLTSALYAILDIKSDILDRPHLRSDAAMLAELTGIPTTVFGIVWIAIAVGVCAWLFQRSFRKA